MVKIKGTTLRQINVTRETLPKVDPNLVAFALGAELVRPTWPEIWMNVAKEISRRSCDAKLQVGCIIVSADNTSVLAVGYNGTYKGGPNRRESMENGKSGCIHSEVNALIKADYNFPKPKHMYTTHSPCLECSRLIINADIKRVVYEIPYRELDGIALLKQVGIEVYTLPEAILIATKR